MARACYPGAPYGCGHYHEHQEAARLGWLRRKLGLSRPEFASEQDRRYLALSVGDVSHVHSSPAHPNIIAFKQGRRWYDLPRSEFKRLVRVGRDIEREEAAEAKVRARAEVKEQRYRDMQERQVRAVQRAERAEVVKIIKASGGIRLGSAQDRGEYELLPSDVRRSNGRLTMDTAARDVNAEMPWLHIEGPDELVNFFEGSRVTRMHQATARQQQRRRRSA